MIEINGETYSGYLQIPDYYTASGVRGGESESLFGVVSVLRIPGAGKIFTLTAKREGNSILGYFTRSQVSALRDIADSGNQVTLNYHGRLHTVMIPLSGINVEMVQSRTDPDEDALFVGTVTLMTI